MAAHSLAEELIVGMFVAEAAIKILAEGKRPHEYWRDGWNLFDFTIVVLSLLPLSGSNAVTVLRASSACCAC